MPLYEYLCKKCGHRFEEIKKFSDKQPKKCPECGGVIEQVISAPAVQFKGSGWYVTDYAKKGSGSTGSSLSSSQSEGDGGGKDEKDSKDTKETKDAKDSKSSKDSTESKKKEDKPKSDSAKKQKKD